MAAPVAHTAAGDVTTASDPASADITVAKPANVADGDVLIAVLNNSISGGTVDVVPAGWTQAALYNTVRTSAVFWKAIPSAAAESAVDYSWHITGGAGRISGQIFRVTGADGDAPIDAVGAGVGSGNSSIVDPAVTAVAAEALLLAVFSSYITGTTPTVITPPGSMSAIGTWSSVSATAATSHLTCHETLAAAGSTGTRTATVAPAGSGATGIMLTIAPGSVAPPPPAPVAHTAAGDVSTATVSSSAVLRVPRPANVADGDLLVGVLFHRNSGGAFTTKPPGWTPFPVAYLSNGVLAAYWRYVTDAAGEPDVYTWRSPNGSARGGAAIFRVTGAAPPTATGGPVDSAGAATGAGTASIIAPATDLQAPSTLLIGCYSTTGTTTTPAAITAPGSMTAAAAVPVVTGSSSAYLLAAAEQVAGAGSSGTRTATVDPAAGSAAGFLLAIAPAGYGLPTPPAVDALLSGGVTHEQASIAYATRHVSAGVRVAVSTSPDLSAPTYSASALPDRDGLGAATFPGLAPATRYYYGIEADGGMVAGATGAFTTLPTPGTPTSFSFAAASCADTNSNAAVFDDVRTRTGPAGDPALFFAHLGDMHYQDIGVADEAWALGAWLNALSTARQLALWEQVPLAYTWSDHDFGGSNVSATSPAAAAVQAAYRRLFPAHALPGDGVGIYQSWQVGRVLVVLTDGRSYMSPITDPDTAAKTKLGAVQKAWFKDQLLTPGVGLVVWLHEDAWHNASTFTGDDTWSAYTTERAELAAFVQDNQVPLLYVHGDVHALSHDDGSHVPGGFPLVSVSPLDQTTFIGNGGLTSGFYPDPISTSLHSEQYGWFDLVDDGTQIVVRFLGISGGAVVMRAEMSWGLPDRRVGFGVPL